MAQSKPVWVQVRCLKCGKKMAENRLEAHLWYIHGTVVKIEPQRLAEDVDAGTGTADDRIPSAQVDAMRAILRS
jgi:hypothetical protein